MLIKEVLTIGVYAAAARLERDGMARKDALYTIITAAQAAGNPGIAATAAKLYEML
jgi:hypothetical protein